MSQSKSQIFFSVKTQFDNMGDALINREMIRLAQQNGDVHLDVSRMPAEFTETLSINETQGTQFYHAFPKLLFSMLHLSFIKQQDCYYFLCPGGQGGEMRGKAKILGFAKLGFFAFLKACGVKICHLGVSFENMGENHLAYLKKRSNFLHRFYVRDEMSKKLLEKNNIRVDGLLPDLAFHLFDNDANAATKPAQKICFNFRTDQYEGQLDDVQSRVKEIIALMPEDTTYAIASQVARDDKGMKALADFMRDDLKLEVETNFNATDIKAMQDFYRTCDCVISNRLHSLMLGASTCDKCIALINAKNQKIAGLFETCGAKDSILYMNSEIEEKTFRKAHQALFKGQKSYQELVQGFSAIFKL